MKVIRIHEFGDSTHLKCEDVERPRIGRGEILVRVRDAGVNPVDFKIREGIFPSQQFPLAMGQDFAGEVVEVADGIADYSPGDEVFGFAHGAYAEYIKTTPSMIAKIPSGVDEEVAAALPTAGLTAWQVIMDEAKVQKGQRVLIHGAGGGVGSVAVQLCKWQGAYVIANASDEDREYLQDLGIDEFIDYHTENFDDKLSDIDVVVDLVGKETYRRSFKVLKSRGVLVTTVHEEGSERDDVRVIRTQMQRKSSSLTKLIHLVSEGKIKVKIDQSVPLEDAAEAMDIVQHEHKQGKVILNVA